MNKTKIALVISAAFVAGTASAASIDLYGRMDSGLKYVHVKGGDDTLEMTNGRATPRVGLNIVEDLGEGWKTKVYLEQGLKADTGKLDNDKGVFFNRRSILAISGPFGEFGMGRAGTVQSTMAPYSMGSIKWDPFGTSYGYASIGTTFANSSRVDNGIHFVSNSLNGFKFGASYSFGDSGDDAVEWQNKNHTLALAVNYITPDFFASLTFANVDQKHQGEEKTLKDGRAYQLGTWYRVTPTFRMYGGFGYQTNWTKGGNLSLTKDYEIESHKITQNEVNAGWDGFSGSIGFQYVVGANKFIGGIQHFNGEAAENSTIDFKRTVFSGAYEYSFAKNVIGYTAVNYQITGGAAENTKDAVTKDTAQVFVGLNYNF